MADADDPTDLDAPTSSQRQETHGAPLEDRINALPVELLQHIMGFVPRGTLDEQLEAFRTLRLTNHNFRRQLMRKGSPLQAWHQELLDLATIRSQNPREEREGIAPYARRLVLEPNVTPEDATFIAFGRVDPHVTGRLWAWLEFQPATEEDWIESLRTQHPRRHWEGDDPYARRLGQTNATPEDATFIAFERVDPRATDRLRAWLAFQPATEEAWIENLRTQHPKGQEEDVKCYERRLGLANVTPEDATRLAYGRVDPRVTDRLRVRLEFQPADVRARIENLRTQHPREDGEFSHHYARRLGPANVTPEDATLLAMGRVDTCVTAELRTWLEFQPAHVRDQREQAESSAAQNRGLNHRQHRDRSQRGGHGF